MFFSLCCECYVWLMFSDTSTRMLPSYTHLRDACCNFTAISKACFEIEVVLRMLYRPIFSRGGVAQHHIGLTWPSGHLTPRARSSPCGIDQQELVTHSFVSYRFGNARNLAATTVSLINENASNLFTMASPIPPDHLGRPLLVMPSGFPVGLIAKRPLRGRG